MARRLVHSLSVCLAAIAGLLAVLGTGTAAAAEAPRWDVLTRTAPTNLPPGGKGDIIGVIVNLGDAPVFATHETPVTISGVLPAGLNATGPMVGYAARGDNEAGGVSENPLECAALPAISCRYVGLLPPFIAIEVSVNVEVRPEAGAPGEQYELKVEGGNAPSKSVTQPIHVDSTPTQFGIERYELTPENEDGSVDTQAGSHPFQLTTTIAMNQTLAKDPLTEHQEKPARFLPTAPALLRNLTTTLPAGLVADARATVFPRCSAAAFSVLRSGNSNECPASTAIGAAVVTFKENLHLNKNTATVPVFNLVPEAGEPARFGFVFEKVPVILDTALKTGEGYAVQVKVKNTSQAAELLSSIVTVWGVPGASAHAGARGWECLGGGMYVEELEPRPPCPAVASNPPPYLIMPTTSCSSALESSATAQSWAQTSFGEDVPATGLGLMQECDSLEFAPTINAQPDQHTASTPSGLTVEVNVPQGSTLATSGRAEADVEATTVTLPEGMTSNAGASDGLGLCEPAGAGFAPPAGLPSLEAELERQLFTSAAVSCPNASKVGTVNIKTPLLDNELKGYVYFGSQNVNPFASPLVLYLTAEDPETGVRVKLAGEVRINQETGQLTSVFKNTPPVPFERLRLHMTNGPRATQTTPPFCRPNTTSAQFTPTSGQPPVEASSSFSLTPNEDGQPCPSQGPLPFGPGFEAGTNQQAGGFTSFSLTIKRPDGQQALKTVSVTMPPGLAALLSKVTPCPEPGAAVGQCGPESEIGHSTAISGLGSDPVSLPGTVYLTEGYGGAPFGIVDVTEATAEPFHLGTVVVRSKVNVDPYTAAVTVTSDPLPQFVRGVPSQIKELNVIVDRSEFEFNPTSCAQLAVSGTLGGYEGTSSSSSVPFRATNCGSLPFTPSLTASAGGHGTKAGGTSLSVKITSAGLGQAGIAKVFLTIPKILPSRLTTIQKACPDAVFEQNPAACDEGSLIGQGIIHTPVFRNPLHGPAYLVSHGNAAFPDVEFVLQSEGIEKGVTIILDGKTDIKKGVTYSRFESAPDAPFTSFETTLPAGPHSALTINNSEAANYDICSKKVSLPTEITGQNGAVIKPNTSVAITGCAGVKASKESRSQKLAKALSKCRKQYKHSKRKRAACEAKARKKFGAKKKPKTKKKK